MSSKSMRAVTSRACSALPFVPHQVSHTKSESPFRRTLKKHARRRQQPRALQRHRADPSERQHQAVRQRNLAECAHRSGEHRVEEVGVDGTVQRRVLLVKAHQHGGVQEREGEVQLVGSWRRLCPGRQHVDNTRDDECWVDRRVLVVVEVATDDMALPRRHRHRRRLDIPMAPQGGEVELVVQVRLHGHGQQREDNLDVALNALCCGPKPKALVGGCRRVGAAPEACLKVHAEHAPQHMCRIQ
mmetsp:Transcript_15649/g.46156  ORF Transcript_15649/g.46156 Transcript_15649/m.46156 type:complete len:243 (-) Transcript_15649:688-1416(-)